MAGQPPPTRRPSNCSSLDFGRDHRTTASVWHNLAGLALARGSAADGAVAATRAVQIRTCDLGSDHHLVGQDLAVLGAAFLDLGQLDEAEETLGRALDIFGARHPADQYEVAVSLSNLGICQLRRGDYTAAETLLRRGLESNIQCSDPTTLRSPANSTTLLSRLAANDPRRGGHRPPPLRGQNCRADTSDNHPVRKVCCANALEEHHALPIAEADDPALWLRQALGRSVRSTSVIPAITGTASPSAVAVTRGTSPSVLIRDGPPGPPTSPSWPSSTLPERMLMTPSGSAPPAARRSPGGRMGVVMDARIDDRDWCAARLAAGDTVAAIGQAAGVSRQTASAWLKRHGLHANHQPRLRPDPVQLAADYERTRSMRKLAVEYGISPAVMRTWLFEAGVDPLGTPGRPAVAIDVDDVQARRTRGETWAAIAEELGVSVETLRRRVDTTDPHPFPTGIRAELAPRRGTEGEALRLANPVNSPARLNRPPGGPGVYGAGWLPTATWSPLAGCSSWRRGASR